MFTKSSLTEHPVMVKIATRAQTEQFALLSEQHWAFAPFFSAHGLENGGFSRHGAGRGMHRFAVRE